MLLAWRDIPQDSQAPAGLPHFSIVFGGISAAFRALRNRSVLRWLLLLEFSDLMLDVFYGFLALYFVDVAGFSTGNAALAVAVWTGVGLPGDFLLIPLLERVRGWIICAGAWWPN